LEELTRILRLVTRVRAIDRELKVLENCVKLATGAEAQVFRCIFLGVEAVVKIRAPKPFLDPRIDLELRISRTRKEARALLKAMELGVRVPAPLWIDEDMGLLIVQYIDGELMREYVLKRGFCEDTCRYFEMLGEYLGRMHSEGLVHGDPTTSNAIVCSDGELYLIDFGLAEFSDVVDDKAIDVHIAFRAIESTHFVAEREFKDCFLRGYSRSYRDWQIVLKRVHAIRLMGRYVERSRRTVWSP